MNTSRRHFLLVAAGAFVRGGINQVEPNLLVRSARPEDLEMSLAGFSDYLTPAESLFVRTHAPVPRIDLDEWRLSIDGVVATPLTLTMHDVKQLPAVEIVSVLECAGNGRSFFEPPVPGLQWANGAVGNGRWRGARLADVLKRAGVKGSAREVLFNGADVPLGTMPDFQRSMPMAKALHADTLLAYELNREALQVKHGFPLRVVAPGWSGHAWTKWLTSISVLDREYDGFWTARAYRRPDQPVQPGAIVPAEEMRPVTSLRVKSVIRSPPHNSSTVVGEPVRIRGVAWSGDAGPVTAVDVSIDNGRNWRTATLQRGQRTAFGWRQWEYMWTPARQAYYAILARANDAGGNVQPSYQEWNPSGYGWNVIPRIGVNVVSVLPNTPEPSHAVSAEEPAPAEALRSSCVVCHDQDVIRQQRLTRAQWDAEIRKMIGWGARVRDEDRDGLLEYLARAFDPWRPPPNR